MTITSSSGSVGRAANEREKGAASVNKYVLVVIMDGRGDM